MSCVCILKYITRLNKIKNLSNLKVYILTSDISLLCYIQTHSRIVGNSLVSLICSYSNMSMVLFSKLCSIHSLHIYLSIVRLLLCIHSILFPPVGKCFRWNSISIQQKHNRSKFQYHPPQYEMEFLHATGDSVMRQPAASHCMWTIFSIQ